MTPPDQPEEAPSALSRLERALAGFGEPKAPPAPEPPPEPEPEPVAEEPAPVAEVPEAEPVEPAEEEEEAEDEAWAQPSSSVLDIAAAVAAVERLSSAPASPSPPLPAAPPSDADALVLAATAAGTAAPRQVEPPEPIVEDEDEDDEAVEPPLPRFEPADLRARIQEFATEDEAEEEPEEEEEPEPDEDLDEEPEEEERAPEAWQRNIGETTLPYFLVEDSAPLPLPPDPVAQVEELRETIVRPPKPAEEKQPVSIARTLAEIPVLLIVAALIAFLVKTFLAQAYYIPSGSMLPQLQIDDRVVVSKLAYKAHDPRRGDIIVFDDPRPGASTAKADEGLLRKVGEGIGIVQPSTDEFIKRVIGLPGETVEGKNGHVYVNGHKLIEPYLKDTVVTSDFEKQTVKPGRLWVMGDNRTGSADSRVFGQIKIDTIVGRALVKVWPLDHVSFL